MSSSSSIRLSDYVAVDTHEEKEKTTKLDLEDFGKLEDHEGITINVYPVGDGDARKSKQFKMHNLLEPINMPIRARYAARKDGLGDNWDTKNDQIYMLPTSLTSDADYDKQDQSVDAYGGEAHPGMRQQASIALKGQAFRLLR